MDHLPRSGDTHMDYLISWAWSVVALSAEDIAAMAGTTPENGVRIKKIIGDLLFEVLCPAN